jgi:uncharacterized membrane protein YhaH (DUF805 family)
MMPNADDLRRAAASLLEWRGRLSRRDFAIIFAGSAYALLAASLLGAFLPSFVPLILMAAFAVIVCLAMIGRLHDRGRSGWWSLVAFGPISAAAFSQWWMMEGQIGNGFESQLPQMTALIAPIPMFWGFVELFWLHGTLGPNRFGPDPR